MPLIDNKVNRSVYHVQSSHWCTKLGMCFSQAYHCWVEQSKGNLAFDRCNWLAHVDWTPSHPSMYPFATQKPRALMSLQCCQFCRGMFHLTMVGEVAPLQDLNGPPIPTGQSHPWSSHVGLRGRLLSCSRMLGYNATGAMTTLKACLCGENPCSLFNWSCCRRRWCSLFQAKFPWRMKTSWKASNCGHLHVFSCCCCNKYSALIQLLTAWFVCSE